MEGFIYYVIQRNVCDRADGLKLHVHDQRPESRVVEGLDVHDFCTYSTTHSQTYPLLMVAEQYQDSIIDR